jgi:hypothetical protein
MLHPRAPAATLLVRTSVAPFLILLTPFAVFVHHHRYGFMHPEIAIALLMFAGIALVVGAAARRSQRLEILGMAALLTWFADIQLRDPGAKQLVLLFAALCAVLWPLREHAPRIVSMMMATILATSLLPPGGVAAGHSSLPGRDASGANAAARATLPLIVHLVLDEHIGVEGLPDALTPATFKDEIRAFFVERGFRLFGGAYSEHPATVASLSHLLNLVPGRYVPGLAASAPRQRRYQLTRNAYFERLADAGYAIRAHRVDYLDVCAGQIPASVCRSYEESLFAALHDVPAPAVEKFSMLAAVFLEGSHAITRAREAYSEGRLRVARAGVHLPDWNWNPVRVSPGASMAALDSIAADVARSQRGELFFAHLLMPHHPYIYDAECRPRPPAEWLHTREDGRDARSGPINTPAGRALRYSRYFDQVRCADRKIDQILDAVPAPLRHDAIVIVHGDHGSRIGLVGPNSGSDGSFGAADYADFFSTLFAVRSGSIEAGYDSEPTPITCLLRTLVESSFTSVARLNACSSPNVVFFNDHTSSALPDFRHARQSQGQRTALANSAQR